jgi:GxxExxY protein
MVFVMSDVEIGPHSDLTEKIIGAAITVHRALGPGLLESAYETCLALELESMGLSVKKQMTLPIEYRGHQIPQAFRLDLVVERLVILELKVVDMLIEAHEAQVLSYLRFSGLPVGLLLNFGVRHLSKNGVRRFLGLDKPAFPL